MSKTDRSRGMRAPFNTFSFCPSSPAPGNLTFPLSERAFDFPLSIHPADRLPAFTTFVPPPSPPWSPAPFLRTSKFRLFSDETLTKFVLRPSHLSRYFPERSKERRLSVITPSKEKRGAGFTVWWWECLESLIDRALSLWTLLCVWYGCPGSALLLLLPHTS